mmetsp:Transcript_8960/g.27880  ORF Transcript_8960/g.27880 Transcript_8960/m.27880 type:complete len:266 (-) Transcript_8960:647-1444(-)
MRRRRLQMELRSPPPPSSVFWAPTRGVLLLSTSFSLVRSEGQGVNSSSSEVACSEAVGRQSVVGRSETDMVAPCFFAAANICGKWDHHFVTVAVGDGAAPARMPILLKRCHGMCPSTGAVLPLATLHIHSCRRASAASGRSPGLLVNGERTNPLHMSVILSLKRGLASRSTSRLRVLCLIEATLDPPSKGKSPSDSAKKRRAPELKQSTFCPYCFPHRTSGAAKPGVPHCRCISRASDRRQARPKSASMARPSAAISTFCGLTSR